MANSFAPDNYFAGLRGQRRIFVYSIAVHSILPDVKIIFLGISRRMGSFARTRLAVRRRLRASNRLQLRRRRSSVRCPALRWSGWIANRWRGRGGQAIDVVIAWTFSETGFFD